MQAIKRLFGLIAMVCVTLPALAAVTPLSSVPDVVFTSPSGNIRCLMPGTIGMDVRCDLGEAQRSYTRRPAECSGAWGLAFAVGPTGPGRLICATETFRADDARVLPYGAILSYGGVTCRSAESGMSCTNDEGGGFRLRRSEQQVF